jgi:hypothetical protein
MYFSPDGQHYASIVTTAAYRSYVFTDGKKHQDYQRISPPIKGDALIFTADSSKLLYMASSSTGPSFLIVNGEESGPLLNPGVPVVSLSAATTCSPRTT